MKGAKDIERAFAPVTSEDVSDEKLTPKRFEFFAGEVRDALAEIDRKIDRLVSLAEDQHSQLIEVFGRLHKVEQDDPIEEVTLVEFIPEKP